MNLKDALPFNQEPKTKAQIICQAMISGEITKDVAFQHMAVHIADSLEDHVVSHYRLPSDRLVEYVISRCNGKTERDPVFAVKNGEWIILNFKLHLENSKDIELLVWAKDIYKKIYPTGEKNRLIQNHIDRFIDNESTLATQYWDNALKAQELDANDRPIKPTK